jgi:hypothetical protein
LRMLITWQFASHQQRSCKLFFIVKMFENMYGGKNIKSKYFDFIYVHVIWNTLGHSTLDVYGICNVIYIDYQIRNITYKWPIFCEFWPKKILLPPLPCHEVALINKTQDINIFLQKESIVDWLEWVGLGRPFCAKNFIICSTTNMTNLVFWKKWNQRTISMMS